MFHRLLIILAAVSITACSSLKTSPEPDPNTLPPTASGLGDIITVQNWTSIGGKAVRSLTRHSRYPSGFSSEEPLALVDFASGQGDKYGRRIHGVLSVTETANYRFRLSADESAELWLSPDIKPENKRLIAFTNKPTGYLIWDRYKTQLSPSLSLEAGGEYFIEILHKENTGDDYLRVEWGVDGGSYTVLSDAELAGYTPPTSDPGSAIDEVAVYESGYHAGYTSGMNLIAYDASYPIPDQDNDGMPDFFELLAGTDPNDMTDALADTDGDQLTNYEEYQLLSNPNNSDTDGDSIPDGYELAYGMDALDSADATLDSDGDGVSNLDEFISGTEPNNSISFPSVPSATNVLLTWETPKSREDGSALSTSDIQGYKIYSGTDVENLSEAATVEGANQLSYETSLEEGTYYYSISTLTTDGKEGTRSGILMLTAASGDLNSHYIADATTDTDGDSIPDLYELANNLDAFNSIDATLDSDGDGVSNLEEYLATTSTGDSAPSEDPTSSPPDDSTTTPPEPVSREVMLSWEIPTQREDGSILLFEEIQNYKIYSGTVSTDLSAVANISDPSQISYTQVLEEGTYYYSISTVTRDGREGPRSQVISLTVN